MGLKRKQHPDTEDAEEERIKGHKTDEQPSLPTRSPPPVPNEPAPEEHPPLPDEPLPDDAPPLPDEPVPDDAPPLPDEPAPTSSEDSEDESAENQANSALAEQNPETTATDAWQAIWEPSAQAYYFHNTETKETTSLNPRLPPDEAAAYLAAHPPRITQAPNAPPEDVFNPETGEYGFTGRFNLRTGKFQNSPEITAENFSTQGQLMRTAREYFDVKQMQEGKIVGQSGGALKAERKAMKVPKSAMKELIRRRKEKRDQNKREWLINDDIIVRKH